MVSSWLLGKGSVNPAQWVAGEFSIYSSSTKPCLENGGGSYPAIQIAAGPKLAMPTTLLETLLALYFKPRPETNPSFGQGSTPLYHIFDRASPNLLEVELTLSSGSIDGMMGAILKIFGQISSMITPPPGYSKTIHTTSQLSRENISYNFNR